MRYCTILRRFKRVLEWVSQILVSPLLTLVCWIYLEKQLKICNTYAYHITKLKFSLKYEYEIS